MSGGALDYFWTRIDDAVEEIRAWVERVGSLEEWNWTPNPHYVKEHPDALYLKSAADLKDATMERMKTIARICELAARLGKEAEWMMIDDTGPEEFCLNTDNVVEDWHEDCEKERVDGDD